MILMKSKTEGLFCSACYILALIAIITGFCDLIFGVSMQRSLGLQLPEAAFTDPLLKEPLINLGCFCASSQSSADKAIFAVNGRRP